MLIMSSVKYRTRLSPDEGDNYCRCEYVVLQQTILMDAGLSFNLLWETALQQINGKINEKDAENKKQKSRWQRRN